MARKQDNYENDFLGCLRWNNEWFSLSLLQLLFWGSGDFGFRQDKSHNVSGGERPFPHNSWIDEDQNGASRWGF